MKSPQSKKNIFITIIVFIIFFSCLFIGEVSLRLFKSQEYLTYNYLLKMVPEHYVDGDFIPFTLKKNNISYSWSQEYKNKKVKISTNNFGFRKNGNNNDVLSYEKAEGMKRILVLGDSYTFGVYVNDHQTYPSVLERNLKNNHNNIQVLNIGYAGGFSPDAHYVWLVNEGYKYKPDLIIYGFFIGNDIGYCLTEDRWQEINELGLPTKIVNKNITIDKFGILRSSIQDSKTVGADFIYKIPIIRNSHFITRLYKSFVIPLNLIINDFFINEKKEKAYDECTSPLIYITEEKTKDKIKVKREKDFLNLVDGMKTFSNHINSKFLLGKIPINFQVEEKFLSKFGKPGNKLTIKRNFFNEIKPFLRSNQIHFVDFLEEMKKNPNTKYFPRNGEVHFNSNGNKFVGEKLYHYIINNNLI